MPLEIAKQFQGLSPGNSPNFSGQKSKSQIKIQNVFKILHFGLSF